MIVGKKSNIIVVDQFGRAEGIIINKKYQITYRLNDLEKSAVMNFTGKEIIQGYSGLVNFINDQFNANDIDELIGYSKQFVVAWGTLASTNESKYAQYIIDEYGYDLFSLMKDFINGQRKYRELVRDMIAGYICISKSRYAAGDFRKNALHLHDQHFDHMCKEFKESVIETWEDHNITKRRNISTKEEFVEIFQKGSLTVDWSEKRLI